MNAPADRLALATALATRGRAGGAVICALAPGDDLATRLSDQLGAERVFSHSTGLGADTLGSIPIELDAADIDRDAPCERLWPGGLLTEHARSRRIDTLYDGYPISLLVLSDPSRAAATLQGAARAAARDRPAVLLDMRAAAKADGQQIREALPGYKWFHPAASLTCCLPDGTLVPDVYASPSATEISVAFDRALACAGLHSPEPGAPAGGRWTGASIETWFAMPRPAAGTWELRLEVADWGNAVGGFAALVDGRRLAPVATDHQSIRYQPLALDPATSTTLRITLLPPRPTPDLERWPRKIGVRISRAALRRAG
jgi:hypothetical protein